MTALRTPWIGAALGLLALVHASATRAQLAAEEDELESDSASDELGLEEAQDAPAEAQEDTPEADVASEGESSEGESTTAPAQSQIRVQAALGGGVGMRSFERPTPIGAHRLPTATFAAADVGLRVDAWPDDDFSLGFALRYQTSLGLTIEETPPFALANHADTRAERVEIGVAPTFRFGDDGSAPALALPVAFTLRTFWPEIRELMTPGYSLAGPQLRIELVLPLGDIFVLRIGPEAQWIIAIDESIQDGGTGNQGVALGGEGILQLRLGAVFAIELTYRESHALVSAARAGSADFEDVERFATLRLAGTL